MMEENQGTSAIVPYNSGPDNLPIKRKRGRPRKDRSQTPGQAFAQPTPESEKKTPHGRRDPVTDKRNEIVGQAVFGVIDGSFEAGYLVTVRVGNTDTILKGIVFQPGSSVPVTGSNDVAPQIKMIKRAEIPIPRVDTPTHVHGSSSQYVQMNQRPDESSQRSAGSIQPNASPAVNQLPVVPIQSFPAQAVPIQSSPAHAIPIQSSPAQAVPIQSSPAQAVPIQSSPAQAVPIQSSPAQPVPIQSSPAQVHGTQVVQNDSKAAPQVASNALHHSEGFGNYSNPLIDGYSGGPTSQGTPVTPICPQSEMKDKLTCTSAGSAPNHAEIVTQVSIPETKAPSTTDAPLEINNPNTKEQAVALNQPDDAALAWKTQMMNRQATGSANFYQENHPSTLTCGAIPVASYNPEAVPPSGVMDPVSKGASHVE